MKNSYIYQLGLLLSVSLVACSEDDMSSSQIDRFGETEVGFLPSTTRADISDLEGGFLVHATSGSSPTEYMIQGATYQMVDDEWDWKSGEYTWPDTTDGYPVTFYAYDLDDQYTVSDDDTATTLSVAVTVKDAGEQVDILSATTSASSRPTGGKISLAFDHITTRLGLNVIASDGSLLHVQSLYFVGVDDTNTYDFLLAAWGDTTSVTGDDEVLYEYLETSNAAQIVATESDTSSIEGSATNITSSSGSLYVMPQTLTPWDTDEALSDTRVEIIFRSTAVVAEATSDDDQLGYTNAGDHPLYDSLGGDLEEDEPLFIRIAIPLISSDEGYIWSAGSSYTYNVTLGHVGTANGYFASTNYYDEDGNETELPIANAEVGEEVTPGDIHFTVTLNAWEELDGISLL